MTNDKKEFRLENYVYAFEKSLHYMLGVFLASGIGMIIWYMTNHEKWWNVIIEAAAEISTGDPNGIIIRISMIVTAALSALPYYFYYTLKDNNLWNLCNGKKDCRGLKKIYILYEIAIIGIFYLLLPREDIYLDSKNIISAIGALLCIVYIYILYRQHKKGADIGYFIILIVASYAVFTSLCVKNAYKLIAVIGQTQQQYNSVYLMLLFLLNSFINIFLLHTFDSCAETGIISNRIKIIIPMISISVYAPSVMYCFCFEENLEIMWVTAAVITIYEVAISCIRPYETKAKIAGCVGCFIGFVLIMPILILNFYKGSKPDIMIEDWLTMIDICIYLVAIKYYGAIVKLCFPKENYGESKGKIMNNVIWCRNALLGSVLFLLVNYTVAEEGFLLLLSIMGGALLVELFICKYVFNQPKRIMPRKSYIIWRALEVFAILCPIAACVAERVFSVRWLESFQNNPIALGVVEIGGVIAVVLGLYLYIVSKYNKGDWQKIPELDQKQVLQTVLERLREIKKMADSVLQDKNLENFWMAFLTWGLFILIALLSMLSLLCTGDFLNQHIGIKKASETYLVFGIILMLIVVGVDWLILSRNLLNYYMEKMQEGKGVMEYQKTFQNEWLECFKNLRDFKESDAEQFYLGSHSRAMLFMFGATYHPDQHLSEGDIQKIAKTACSIELVHQADIMIDDYFDGDAVRNGKMSYFKQYPELEKLILLRTSLQTGAQQNFTECRKAFRCSNEDVISNMATLSEMMYNSALGHYQELSLAGYDKIKREDIDEINMLETVSLFRDSIGLGYSCFHKSHGNKDYEALKKLGTAFGRFYQCMNDLEPFSAKNQYQKFKGTFKDIGRKNTVKLRLYECFAENCADKTQRDLFSGFDNAAIRKLYEEYAVEQEFLNDAQSEINEIRDILEVLERGNQDWVKKFVAMFNKLLLDRQWSDKLSELK